jgi:sugar phosphate isomerase/epimerase
MNTRRQFIKTATVGLSCHGLHLASTGLLAAPTSGRVGPVSEKRTGMGLVTYALGNRQKAGKASKGTADLNDPAEFLEACRALGAGGMQVPLGVRDDEYTRELRRKAEGHGLHVEAIINLPKDAAEAGRFEQQVVTAKSTGAELARTVMLPGRRYEQFKTRAEFDQSCAQGLKSLQLAEPIAAKHRFRLAVENHKDHLIAEKLAVLKQISSPYVGMCVDVANNFALCEDPVNVIRAFAPWAFTVHIKDQSIRECEEGFWLTDVALGEGFLDLKTMVGILRKAKPDIRFNLEVITRDPIKVPVRTDPYWATFPGRPRSDAEPMFRTARERGASKPLPLVSSLSNADQVSLEQSNIEKSIVFAREQLGL